VIGSYGRVEAMMQAPVAPVAGSIAAGCFLRGPPLAA